LKTKLDYRCYLIECVCP